MTFTTEVRKPQKCIYENSPNLLKLLKIFCAFPITFGKMHFYWYLTVRFLVFTSAGVHAVKICAKLKCIYLPFRTCFLEKLVVPIILVVF